MRLFDESTGLLREVEIRPRMGVYVCGITPYDAAHLGHAFTYTHFDVLVRLLRQAGAEVRHVQNVTDVDDDILRVARERGEPYLELAEREVERFTRSMRAIGVQAPTHEPRATRFVPQIVAEVGALIGAGHGYERSGTVYFPVASDPEYGTLSGLAPDQMLALAAERGGHPEDPNKDDPLDFVLWQRSAPGEPAWDSPWGPGRPGWHIECSTMARTLLGQPVDIHGGGTDLIYPHHESERAQAECIPGPRPFVRHWVHTGAVHMDGEKMSKSLGNMAFVGDLLREVSGSDLREFLLRRHYREEWVFSMEDLRRFAATRPDPGDGPADREAFLAALDRDMDIPEGLRVLDRAAGGGTTDGRALSAWGRRLLGLDPD